MLMKTFYRQDAKSAKKTLFERLNYRLNGNSESR
jgi:hypothetical protein